MTRFTDSVAQLKLDGAALRKTLPAEEFSTYHSSDRDPVALINAQNVNRLQELLPLRAQRMAHDAFSFYRGTALLMAHDLAAQPGSGIDVVICGDAHISNFGLYASPERTLVFDLNDFDEASTGPWEWDVRRFVTSVILGARSIGLKDHEVDDLAKSAARDYREILAELMQLSGLDRMFQMIDEDAIRESLDEHKALKFFERTVKKAKKQTGVRASKKMLTTDESGNTRFIENPPVLTQVDMDSVPFVEELYASYLKTVRPDVALLLSTYEIVDIALRVVGVGSVGTRCFVIALAGPSGDHMILQMKEAGPSAVTQFHLRSEPSIQVLPLGSPPGARVVTYQQILQAASDPFLGHVEGQLYNYYVRQFRDLKGSFEVAEMDFEEFAVYVRGCAAALARAHSQSPKAAAIVGYLGSGPEGEAADKAIADWSLAYAEQALRDYEVFRASVG